ncbi:MAG: hypothetical protein QM564_09565 [Bergeyella sp.]
MDTITLQYNTSVKEKLMKFLETFSKNELEIVEGKNTRFDETKAELQKDYLAYKNGETELMSLEEFEKEMNSLFEE